MQQGGQTMSVSTEDYFRYLPVGEETARWGLYVTGTGCSEVPPASRYPRTVHPEVYQFTWEKGRILPEYQIIYLGRGEGVFESVPTGRQLVGAGDAILLFPGVWHRYRPSEKTGWEAFWVSINGDFLHGLVEQKLISPKQAILKTGLDHAILDSFHCMVDRVRNESMDNPLLLAAGTMEILARILAAAGTATAEGARSPMNDACALEDRIVADAVRFIWNHSHRPMTVNDVVAQLPVTRRSLERRFQQALGRTIRDEMTRCRVERVKRLLEETDLPIKQIAAAAGFSNAQRMSKVFHREEGISAAEYRQQHQHAR